VLLWKWREEWTRLCGVVQREQVHRWMISHDTLSVDLALIGLCRDDLATPLAYPDVAAREADRRNVVEFVFPSWPISGVA
jgi:hypothetical protein